MRSASQMVSRCSKASLAASPASFHPSNAATTIVLCSSGSEALTSGEVTDLAYGLIGVPVGRAPSSSQAFSIDQLCLLQAADPNLDDFDKRRRRSRRNTFGCKL